MSNRQKAVRVEQAHMAPVRHPLSVARLLYSAPPWVLAGPIYLVALITFTSLGYSFFATKDEIVVAPLVLERESVTVEAVKSGIVSKIHVNEGDWVDSRGLLLTVQMTTVMKSPEEEAIQSQLDEIDKDEESGRDEYDHQKTQLQISLDQARLSLKDIDKSRRQLEIQLVGDRSNVSHWLKKMNAATSKLREEKKLYDAKDITRSEYDQAAARVDDLSKSYQDAKNKMGMTQVSLDALSKEKIENEISRINDQIGQIGRRWEERQTRYEEQRSGLEQRLKESKNLNLGGGVDQGRLMTSYKSVYSGVVSHIAVKPGNMVAPGTPLVTIVKDSAALQGQVQVRNQDIGRMKLGQIVKIKYFAYPYQEYGISEGVISSIAVKPGGGKDQGSMYEVRVALNEETIQRQNEKPHALEIGLEGTAEIKTGYKRFIELLFSPVSKFFDHQDEE